jgi:hypothetical protein
VPFLTVNGQPVTVVSPSAKKDIERIGTSGRAFAGNLRSVVRLEKRNWTVTTSLLLDVDATSLEVAVANGIQMAVTGDLVGGGTVFCEGTITDSTYLSVNSSDGKGFMRQLTLQLKET